MSAGNVSSKQRVTPCRAAFLRWAKKHRPDMHAWVDHGDTLYAMWQAAWKAARRRG